MKDKASSHECVGDSRSGVFMFSLRPDIGVGSDSVCAQHSSAHRIKSFESLSSQASLGRSSKLLQNQFRSLVSSTLTNSTAQGYNRSESLKNNNKKRTIPYTTCHYNTAFVKILMGSF